MMMTVIRLHTHTHTLNQINNKHTAARTASIIATAHRSQPERRFAFHFIDFLRFNYY